jgi:[acyl-carrier-protein] S-malonyltransferase
MRSLVFPGQGSQSIGMGKALFDASSTARDVFHEVDEALSQKLSRLMFEGDEATLTLTENAQPAIMTVSMALWRILEKEGGLDIKKTFTFASGHSLGEYSALCATGVLPLDVTARLLKTRGQAMQSAVPVGQGAMAALLGLEWKTVKDVCEEAAQGQVCTPANDNAEGQIVISGHTEAVNRAVELAKARGGKRAMLLPVSAPFHCSLMQPAADAMKKALEPLSFQSPLVPIVANVKAEAVSDPTVLKALLVEQVTGQVRWRESVLWMAEQEVTEQVEMGSGKVLSGLVKRISDKIQPLTLNTLAEVEAFLKQVS